MEGANKKSSGPIIGIIVVIIIIIVAGIYFWSGKINTKTTEQEKTYGTGDEIIDLENTANANDIEGMIDGIADIEEIVNQAK